MCHSFPCSSSHRHPSPPPAHKTLHTHAPNQTRRRADAFANSTTSAFTIDGHRAAAASASLPVHALLDTRAFLRYTAPPPLSLPSFRPRLRTVLTVHASVVWIPRRLTVAVGSGESHRSVNTTTFALVFYSSTPLGFPREGENGASSHPSFAHHILRVRSEHGVTVPRRRRQRGTLLFAAVALDFRLGLLLVGF